MKSASRYPPEFLEMRTKDQAAKEMGRIGASGIDIMVPKSLFRVVRLRSVRNSIANIIKQEMLSIGGEAAVNRGTVNCSVPETDVLLMGTLRHYRLLVDKLRIQVGESGEIAEEIEGLFGGMI